MEGLALVAELSTDLVCPTDQNDPHVILDVCLPLEVVAELPGLFQLMTTDHHMVFELLLLMLLLFLSQALVRRVPIQIKLLHKPT